LEGSAAAGDEAAVAYLGQDAFLVFYNTARHHENASFSPSKSAVKSRDFRSMHCSTWGNFKFSLLLNWRKHACEVDAGALQPATTGQESQRSAKDQQRLEELERQRQDLEQQNQWLQEQVEALAKKGIVPRCSQ
jgi:hypothetical protein